MKEIKPIFILSQPRAGSTLLQRIMAASNDIKSVSEPWILLPFLYSTKENGVYAEYGHKLMVQGVKDFCSKLPNGIGEYYNEIRNMTLNLYQNCGSKEAKYFLDKTPRYYLIIEELFKVFPEGKFIFLFRNPLAVVASIVQTWQKNRWCLYHNKIDLYYGIVKLIESYVAFSSKAFLVNYEQLVRYPENTIKNIFNYIELPYHDNLLKSFKNISFDGSWGDKAGIKKYHAISNDSLEKWQTILVTTIRKNWSIKYLKWIGKERLHKIGYDLEDLLIKIKSTTTDNKFLLDDFFLTIYGYMYSFTEPTILKDKFALLNDYNYATKHT